MQNQVAVKAIIINERAEALIVRRPDGRWHEPGGRLEAGELLTEGLLREVLEETGIEQVQIKDVLQVEEWFAKPDGEDVHIVAVYYECHTSTTEVNISNEHAEYAWITYAQLDNYDLEPATKKALVKVLI